VNLVQLQVECQLSRLPFEKKIARYIRIYTGIGVFGMSN